MIDQPVIYRRGFQVVYIPFHVSELSFPSPEYKTVINHPDIEFGFIWEDIEGTNNCRVRYWRKRHNGELRTIANSEMTPKDRLIAFACVNPDVIERAILMILSQ